MEASNKIRVSGDEDEEGVDENYEYRAPGVEEGAEGERADGVALGCPGQAEADVDYADAGLGWVKEGLVG